MQGYKTALDPVSDPNAKMGIRRSRFAVENTCFDKTGINTG
jgi:hypothetical protein